MRAIIASSLGIGLTCRASKRKSLAVPAFSGLARAASICASTSSRILLFQTTCANRRLPFRTRWNRLLLRFATSSHPQIFKELVMALALHILKKKHDELPLKIQHGKRLSDSQRCKDAVFAGWQQQAEGRAWGLSREELRWMRRGLGSGLASWAARAGVSSAARVARAGSQGADASGPLFSPASRPSARAASIAW